MDLLDRLYDQLVLAARRPPYDPGRRDFTIGDVYQHLIPYRSIRSELGLWELAAYEHALLRLLSGERGYLSIPESGVQEELRRELTSPNPILGVYRDYPTVEVRVATGLPPSDPPAPAAEVEPEPLRAVAPNPHSQPAPVSAAPAGPTHSSCCRACSTELPPAPGLRFCPICGADQMEAPCAQCEALLKAEWNFCIRCGTARPAPARTQASG